MSKKKGPLSKIEKFYIDKNPGKSPEELAEDLGRSVTAVSKHCQTRSEHVTSTKKEGEHSVGDLMGNETAEQKRRGVTIMTPAASELSDAVKSNPKPQLNDKVVHRIRK